MKHRTIKSTFRRAVWIAIALLLALSAFGCACSKQPNGTGTNGGDTEARIVEDGHYSSPEDVAAYLHRYHKLPKNYITKQEAMQKGWKSNEGNLWDVTGQTSIGGDRFGNREGLLPGASDRQYYECDVNYTGGFRGPERLVYSDDGLIFYTKDHYKTFVQLY